VTVARPSGDAPATPRRIGGSAGDVSRTSPAAHQLVGKSSTSRDRAVTGLVSNGDVGFRQATILLTLLAACGGVEPAAVRAPPQKSSVARRLVVLSIDGLMPEAYTAPDRHGLMVPNLRRMVARGASASGVTSIFPTVTYPAHTTLATGAPPAVHGITSNRALDVDEKNQGGWRWYAEDIRVDTLWTAIERRGGHAALINWPVTVGATVSTLVPEYWRAGSADDQKLTRALATDGLLADVVAERPDLWQRFTPPDVQDSASIDIALHALAHRAPDLVMIHIWQVDEQEHQHGPWSADARAAIEEADRQLGRLLEALERDPRWPHTVVAVVSDHGFQAIHQELRPGAVLAEAGLLLRDAGGKLVGWQATSQASGGSALVYVARTDDDSLARARAAFAANAGPGRPIARVLERSELAALGADPAAALGLVAAPGTHLVDGPGAVLAPSTSRGTHGYLPDDPAMAASFVAYGPAIPHAALGQIQMIDLAPTFAAWLDVELAGATGTALDLSP
jgi:predicted AlkP superfamily pyrophosphatase or phosphodiesterase